MGFAAAAAYDTAYPETYFAGRSLYMTEIIPMDRQASGMTALAFKLVKLKVVYYVIIKNLV